MSPNFAVSLIVLTALVLASVSMCAEAGEFYFEAGVGIHDNKRDSYKTRSKKMGRVALGYERKGWFGELVHDSDLQDKDVGYDRLYVGHRFKF